MSDTTFTARAIENRWTEVPRPTTPEGWLKRAEEVSDILAADAVERDSANQSPRAEVTLLKDSGLVTLLGPVEHGGGGQTWETTYKVIRTIARGDGSIGQLLGYHYLWAWAARLVGTEDQIAAVEQLYTENNFLFGGAVNPPGRSDMCREHVNKSLGDADTVLRRADTSVGRTDTSLGRTDTSLGRTDISLGRFNTSRRGTHQSRGRLDK